MIKKSDKNAYLGNSGIFIINKELLDKLKPPREKIQNHFSFYS